MKVKTETKKLAAVLSVVLIFGIFPAAAAYAQLTGVGTVGAPAINAGSGVMIPEYGAPGTDCTCTGTQPGSATANNQIGRGSTGSGAN